MNSKRFVSWSAVSSLPQAERISVDMQRKVNEEHIQKWGGVMVASLSVAQSRSITLFSEACSRIAEYQRLHELIQGREFDVLICYRRDRLGRKTSLISTIEELCRDSDILIYETADPPQSLDMRSGYGDMLVQAIKNVAPQNEINELVRRRETGMAGRMNRGLFMARTPYGWTKKYDERGREIIEVDEQARHIIRTALLDMYLVGGMGGNNIVDQMNAIGILSPTGARWTIGTFRTMLDMVRRYAGYVEFNQRSPKGSNYVRAKGSFPTIITDTEMNDLIRERKRRARSRRGGKGPYRFSGVLQCAHCTGRNLVANHTWTEWGGKRYPRVQYQCSNHHSGGYIALSNIMKALEKTYAQLNEIEDLSSLIDETLQSSAELAEIESIDKETVRIHASLERVDDAYASGSMTYPRYDRQVKKLTERLSTLAEARHELEEFIEIQSEREGRAERIRETAADLMNNLTEPNEKKANAWMLRHIRVSVRDNRVENVLFY